MHVGRARRVAEALRLTMPTIAVVEDDSGVLALIKDALEIEGFDVLLYQNGTRALDAFESRSPDLVITDIRMPEMDGIQLLRRLRQKSDTPVILLTGYVDETDELVGLRIGADDFIRKPFSPRVLVERVRTVLRRYRPAAAGGDRQADEGALERGHLRMDKERYTCTWKGRNVELTALEFRLLENLAVRPGVTKTRDALTDIICEDQETVHPRTIDSHIKRLRKKFRRVDETFDQIDSVYAIGYRFADSGKS
jgi:two-component system response regulator ChvI